MPTSVSASPISHVVPSVGSAAKNNEKIRITADFVVRDQLPQWEERVGEVSYTSFFTTDDNICCLHLYLFFLCILRYPSTGTDTVQFINDDFLLLLF